MLEWSKASKRSLWVGIVVAAMSLSMLVQSCDERVSVYVGAKLCVVNETDYGLHIYLNAEYLCTVEAHAQDCEKDLDGGHYDAQARRESDGKVLKSERIRLKEGDEFWWVIGPAEAISEPPGRPGRLKGPGQHYSHSGISSPQ